MGGWSWWLAAASQRAKACADLAACLRLKCGSAKRKGILGGYSTVPTCQVSMVSPHIHPASGAVTGAWHVPQRFK